VSAQYLRSDEREDLLSSLKLVHVSARECREDVQFWKWVLIGTHASLQAAIVFHLSPGNDLLVAKPAHSKKWLEAHRTGGDYPTMHMDFFPELYEKAKAHEVFGFRLASTATQDESVRKLLDLRNDFVHFMPKGWSIELMGLPDICLDALQLVKQLAQGPMSMRWYDDTTARRFHVLLGECQQLLEVLRRDYAAV